MKLLLEKEADVNALEEYYGSALQAASAEGHETVVKLLMENKADVNAQGGQYGSALQAASVRATAVGRGAERDAERNAVLAGDPKCLVYYVMID